ncbi:hypothetical protein SEA_ROSIEPOSIE_49 [Arthrobacter phage RosiePosie]|uniref:Uncharacterized protein n=13 Tax=Klausavirus princesstrina TaxID=1984784 RepID=A0A286N462_9CAUD|nr:hypothetical protein FDI82_gp049 [Arthrobacter phage PrincessTrina]ANU79652.1 hypothetical protein SEA_CONBOY_49 [Arthrobacter phage Conboy]AOZ64602.1 hypothetical protein SEA_CHUBSTER_49 [Arthrobacter phage Chubster]AOZ64714.1 hypothetical protein SEA_CHOCOLAT_49 [Arthrobacter phage Chocolat]APC44733.1 hypothetical protein SEA_EDGARPOE_49 [Arthrobacter phage EdgarPoe]APC44844.1 hypothetical protein SEA_HUMPTYDUMPTY_49 [Arthrobacter phage HumptyDumpty]ASX98834.1 hypothetical protein SEA_KA
MARSSLGSISEVRDALNLGGSVRITGTSVGMDGRGLRIADNAFLKCCNRCGNTYETATRRQPVMRLCQDCKDVLSPQERRGYMVRVAK